MSEKGFWIAFISGAAIGAGIALLYAPQTGKVTRKKLKGSIEDAGEYLKDQAERLSKEAHKVIKISKEYADSAVDAAGDLVATATKSAKQVRSLI